jgi:hypothetical protein
MSSEAPPPAYAHTTTTTPIPTPLPPFPLKSIDFFSSQRHILLQNENGPCPLLALCNVLLLRGDLALPAFNLASGSITFETLCECLANLAIDKASTDLEDVTNSLLKLLPSLAKGLDVNPSFTKGCEGYEYTEALAPFDLFGVKLVHGWLCAEDSPLFGTVDGKTYNQVVELVMTEDDALVQHKARQFLDETSNQLTYHGLTSLHEHLGVNSLSVFFRNNHFSTIFRADGGLYLLVTDVGYEKVREVVWERLGNIDGDTEYVNCEFEVPRVVDDYVGVGEMHGGWEGGVGGGAVDNELQMALAASLRVEGEEGGGGGVGGGGGGGGGGVGGGGGGTRVVLPDLEPAPAAAVPVVAVGVMHNDGGGNVVVDDEALARALELQLQREREETVRRDEEMVRRMMHQESMEAEREAAGAARGARRQQAGARASSSNSSNCAVS